MSNLLEYFVKFFGLVKIIELYERAWKVRQISLNCQPSYRHHWEWVIQDYKEKQLRVQKNLDFKKTVIAVKFIH